MANFVHLIKMKYIPQSHSSRVASSKSGQRRKITGLTSDKWTEKWKTALRTLFYEIRTRSQVIDNCPDFVPCVSTKTWYGLCPFTFWPICHRSSRLSEKLFALFVATWNCHVNFLLAATKKFCFTPLRIGKNCVIYCSVVQSLCNDVDTVPARTHLNFILY